MGKSIFNEPEYYKIFKFILLKGKTRSYEITKEFQKVSNDEGIKIFRQNMSKKIQTLQKKNLIIKVKEGYRTRKGKYGEYIINEEGVTEYFINYFELKTNFLSQKTLSKVIIITLTHLIKNREKVKLALEKQYKNKIPKLLLNSYNKVNFTTLNSIFFELNKYLTLLGINSLLPESENKKFTNQIFKNLIS